MTATRKLRRKLSHNYGADKHGIIHVINPWSPSYAVCDSYWEESPRVTFAYEDDPPTCLWCVRALLDAIV